MPIHWQKAWRLGYEAVAYLAGSEGLQLRLGDGSAG
ncbi:hypothetical protein LCGC14_0960800 [marine sediment metagenome]|uniref:Uncharacterized protein n=1 Tax=marine sediment metagenome TaxID=412755 RepID=A0A0F9NJ92_9ZZZZ